MVSHTSNTPENNIVSYYLGLYMTLLFDAPLMQELDR